MLKLVNCSLKINTKEILKDISLTVKPQEIHVLLGPNGHGKSSLLKGIAGLKEYQFTNGNIFWFGNEINELELNLRFKKNIFLVWQSSRSLPGLSNLEFYKQIIGKRTKTSFAKKYQLITEALNFFGLKDDFLKRSVNEKFSGGEMKINEAIQLFLAQPKLALIDEIDSGVDASTLKKIIKLLMHLQQNFQTSLIIVSHHEKIINAFKNITQVHVMYNGKIVKSGSKAILNEVNKYGYSGWLIRQNIRPISTQPHLSACAVGENSNQNNKTNVKQ